MKQKCVGNRLKADVMMNLNQFLEPLSHTLENRKHYTCVKDKNTIFNPFKTISKSQKHVLVSSRSIIFHYW